MEAEGETYVLDGLVYGLGVYVVDVVEEDEGVYVYPGVLYGFVVVVPLGAAGM